jgi:hypothetical protein
MAWWGPGVESVNVPGEPWPTDEVRVAVEHELDALGDPSRCRALAELSDILTADCTDCQLIARYLWAALAITGEWTQRRVSVLEDMEWAVIDASNRAAEVGENSHPLLGTPVELLSILADDGPHWSEGSRVDGLPPSAARSFIKEAWGITARLVTPRVEWSRS